MTRYEHIVWYVEPKPCDICRTPTFMAALREMSEVHLARDAQPQPLCLHHLVPRLSERDAARVEQDLEWLGCTAVVVQTTRNMTASELETAVLVLRMNYTLFWLLHMGLREEAQAYRATLEHDPALDQRTHLTITWKEVEEEAVPEGTAITLDAPQSVIHGKARAALLQALQPASPLSVDISVAVSGETRNVELPQESTLRNVLV